MSRASPHSQLGPSPVNTATLPGASKCGPGCAGAPGTAGRPFWSRLHGLGDLLRGLRGLSGAPVPPCSPAPLRGARTLVLNSRSHPSKRGSRAPRASADGGCGQSVCALGGHLLPAQARVFSQAARAKSGHNGRVRPWQAQAPSSPSASSVRSPLPPAPSAPSPVPAPCPPRTAPKTSQLAAGHGPVRGRGCLSGPHPGPMGTPG